MSLAQENEALRQRLHEAEELIQAVRTGGVDALAIQGAGGPRIFTLHSADADYRTLIEQMSEGAVLLDADGLVLYCNAALARLLGRALADMLGSYFAELVPPAYRLAWAVLSEQGWQGPARGELPLLSGPDGAMTPFSVSLNQLSLGGVPTLAVLLADISADHQISNIRAVVARQRELLDLKNEELARQEAARRASEQAAAAVSQVLDNLPQIAWTADPEGEITFLNCRWMEYVEPPAGRPRNEWILSCFHPDDLAPALLQWQSCMRTGEPLEIELRLRHHTGAYRWMLGRARPARDGQGRLQQWIGTYTDIHERKLAEEREAQAQAQLQANNQALTRANVDLDNFIYAASHDLRAPISNLAGLLDALREELAPAPLPPPAPPILGMMQDAIERFQHTIDQLTDVARLQREAGQAAALVAVAPVLAGVRLDLAPLIRASGGALAADLDPGLRVALPEKNLRSLLFNLLSNAFKYRHPARPPQVTLRAHPLPDHPGHVELTVQDNGLGLDRAGQQRLFGLFERLHNHVEGSGMGLYMVKRMVENAGGQVRVASELGTGSTFTVRLPGELRVES